jgi:hypothetical protein
MFDLIHDPLIGVLAIVGALALLFAALGVLAWLIDKHQRRDTCPASDAATLGTAHDPERDPALSPAIRAAYIVERDHLADLSNACERGARRVC